MMDNNESIISKKEAIDLLKKLENDEIYVRHDLKPYNEENDDVLGHHGEHLRLDIVTKSNNVYKFFVKTMPVSNKLLACYIKKKYIYEREQIFFYNIAPEFEQFKIQVQWAPKCYLAKENTFGEIIFFPLNYLINLIL